MDARCCGDKACQSSGILQSEYKECFINETDEKKNKEIQNFEN